MAHQPCHVAPKPGSHAAVTTAPVWSVAKMSSLSAERDTALTGASAGKVWLADTSDQPCQVAPKAGSHAAVRTRPSRSVTNTSRCSSERLVPCTGARRPRTPPTSTVTHLATEGTPLRRMNSRYGPGGATYPSG